MDANTCTANSVPYQQSTLSVTATELPISCTEFKNQFDTMFRNCFNEATAFGWKAALGVTGGIVTLAGVATLAYCIYAKKCCKPKCCN